MHNKLPRVGINLVYGCTGPRGAGMQGSAARTLYAERPQLGLPLLLSPDLHPLLLQLPAVF